MRHVAHGLAASGDRLARVVITADGKQRIRLRRSLTSMFVYVVSILAIEYAIRSGIIRDLYWVRWLQVGMILWMAGVYAVLRSGLNERLADRGLTNLQILGANTWIILGYALCPAIGGMAIATAPSLRVTFSAGVAQFRQGENTAAVIERADQALYKAKENGRNQTRY